MSATRPHVILSESVTYCTDQEGIEIAPRAWPWFEQYLRENGYQKVEASNVRDTE